FVAAGLPIEQSRDAVPFLAAGEELTKRAAAAGIFAREALSAARESTAPEPNPLDGDGGLIILIRARFQITGRERGARRPCAAEIGPLHPRVEPRAIFLLARRSIDG